MPLERPNGFAIEDWQTLTLINGWSRYSLQTRAARIRADPFGLVHLSGFIQGGSAIQIASAIPGAFRPSLEVSLSAACSGASGMIPARIYIGADGIIRSSSMQVAWLSLDGLRYWLS